MAFEKIYEFVDGIERRMNAIREKQDAMLKLDRPEWDALKLERRVLSAAWDIHFAALQVYLETTLKTAKFKDQRRHCIDVMTRLDPSFMKVYLMTPTQLKKHLNERRNDQRTI